MKIYKNDTEFIDADVTDSSYRYRAIRGDNTLTLYFSSPTHVEIPVGSWTEFQSQRYELTQPENFKKHSTRNFEYTLVMEGEQARLKRYKFRDTTSGRLKFSYTAKPQEHLKMLVGNLNSREFSENTSENLLWKVGDSIDSVEKVISYNHTSCWDALNQMADTFETEWEIDGRTIHLRKVEYNKDTEQEKPLVLSYGKGNGFKSGVGRSNADNSNPVEVLFVQGGNKNIDSSTYGNSVLLLPQEQQLEYEGRTYVVDKEGLSIRRADTELKTGMEDSLDCGHIYPHREGTVSKVESIEKDDLYDFIDESIPESLDYNKYLLEGESITIIFQEGMLVGKEFEVNYVHPERRFEIVPQDFDGQQMPNKNFKPEVGQKYAVFGIGMPENYLRDDETQSGASWDMFREAAKFLYENEKPRFSFTGELDGLWSKSDWTNIGGKIKLGGYVLFSDNQFQPEGMQIRIVGIKDFINNPYSPTIELSNVTVGGTVSSQLKKVDSNEVVVEELHRDALQFTKRRYRDVQETMKMLEEAQLNFSNSIQPLTVETMQAIVGDESLQFRFIKSREEPIPVTHEVRYDKYKRKLMADAGVLQHMTLGIDAIRPTPDVDMYKYWELPEYESAVLDKPEKTFYLYAKVSKNGGNGEFRLEEQSQAMDEEDYYYLLMGILNSEYEGERSFVSLYGYTEILPGRITTDRIVSTDGSTYFDLLHNEIGGRIKFVSKAGEDPKDLAETILGINNEIDEMVVGGDNLISNSSVRENGGENNFAIREVEVEAGKEYIFSVKAKANKFGGYGRVSLNLQKSEVIETIDFTEQVLTEITFRFSPTVQDTLYIASQGYVPSGLAEDDEEFYVEWYMLLEGNTATTYKESLGYVTNAIKHVANAIENGSTIISGGLALTELLMVKDSDGKIKGGISGMDDDGVSFFAHTDDAYEVATNYMKNKDNPEANTVRPNFAVSKEGHMVANRGFIGNAEIVEGDLRILKDSSSIIITNKKISEVSVFPTGIKSESRSVGTIFSDYVDTASIKNKSSSKSPNHPDGWVRGVIPLTDSVRRSGPYKIAIDNCELSERIMAAADVGSDSIWPRGESWATYKVYFAEFRPSGEVEKVLLEVADEKRYVWVESGKVVEGELIDQQRKVSGTITTNLTQENYLGLYYEYAYGLTATPYNANNLHAWASVHLSLDKQLTGSMLNATYVYQQACLCSDGIIITYDSSNKFIVSNVNGRISIKADLPSSGMAEAGELYVEDGVVKVKP
jgi:hypothetical protein